MMRRTASSADSVSSFTRRAALGAGAAALVLACSQPRAASPAPVRALASDVRQRETVSLTVYNQDFGVVRERRALALGEGPVELSYGDVAAKLEPQTVHIRGIDAPAALNVLEQNYRYDLLSPDTLLKKFVGKTIKVYRYDEKLGREEEKSAEVLAAEQGVVLRIDGQLTYGVPGRFAFPGVPPNLVQKPTLVWLLDSQRARQSVEVTYLTGGLSWSADYVLALSADERHADLTGWVTLTNESGASFENAELKLVAGDVQRVQPPVTVSDQRRLMKAEVAQAPQFRQESLFEYHLYTLARPTSVRDNEKKQVSLLEARGVNVERKLELRSSEQIFRPVERTTEFQTKVAVFLEFTNSADHGLGQPLPKGVIRVYEADQSGAEQFVGEDSIAHTARDEKVRIRLGEAFDVVADRKELRVQQISSCQTESDWEITLRNHKDTAERVGVTEPTGGDWTIAHSSLPARRVDAHTFAFDVDVPARGETKLTYTVRVRWC